MIGGTTSGGFSFSLDETALDNMELVDALADAQNDDPIAVSRACLLLLGRETRKQLYDHVRTPDGRVPIEEIAKSMVEILEAFGKAGKN